MKVSRLEHAVSAALSRFVRRIHGTRAGFAIGELMQAGYEASENLNHFAIPDNGERWLVQHVAKKFHPSRVLDVGANRGEWLEAVFLAMPDAEIVACEPQPDLAARLKDRYQENPRIRIQALALGRSDGELPLYQYPGHDYLASGINWHPNRETTVAMVPQCSGRSLMTSLGWERVDLMKIDVEGMEYDVLSSFQEMLASGSIAIVQFEFGGFALQQRVLMKDFCSLFGPNYRIGRLMPRGVDFRDYDFRWETWALSNFVACRKDLIAEFNA
jgi:FkbM family methyltransferase